MPKGTVRLSNPGHMNALRAVDAWSLEHHVLILPLRDDYRVGQKQLRRLQA